MPIERKNPYSAFNFAVIADGPLSGIGVTTNKVLGGFMEVTGLDGENSPIEYREGTDQSSTKAGAFMRKMPGLERYPNVVVKRGITGDLTLWKWRQLVRDKAHTIAASKVPLEQIAIPLRIELRDENHTPVLFWKLENAWLYKLSGPSLNAKGNEFAVETAEFCCERILIDTELPKAT